MKNIIFSLSLTFLVLFISINAQSTSSKAPAQPCSNNYGTKLIGECKNVDDCLGAALKGNCTNKQFACCIPDTSKAITENPLIKKNTFLKLVGNTPRNNFLYNHFVDSMNIAQVNQDAYKASAFFSQLVGESNYFKDLESGVFDQDFNNDLGNNSTGDGILYHGRGGILLRGKKNYDLANSQIRDLGFNIIVNPERVAFPSVAFKTAAWFWKQNAYVIKSNGKASKENLGLLADGTFHNFTLLTHSLTNNLEKLKQRSLFNDLVLNEIKVGTMKRGFGVQCEINEEKGYAVPICLLDFKKPYCGCEGKYDMRSCPYGLTADGRCRSSSLIKCCIEKCRSALDLVILMDSSGSIGVADFKKEQQFVNMLLSNLVIGENDTRVSVINYNTRPYIITDFTNFVDYNTIVNKVNSIVYNGGNTYTFDALKLVNERILQVNLGMRPIEVGIPKVVVVITDGASQNMTGTLFQAKRIKDRGFNIITVGVGSGINLAELIGMASSPNDQYDVSDFNKILLILSSLARTTCQQAAEVISETEIEAKVEKDSYKYYKYSIKANNTVLDDNTNMKRFTIELNNLNGNCELFYSFEDENPKSNDDFINPNDVKKNQTNENFIEKTLSRNKRSPIFVEQRAGKRKYYQITRPDSGQSDVLYFSVKGLEMENEFQVYVFNKTVNSAESLHKQANVWFISFFFIFISLCYI